MKTRLSYAALALITSFSTLATTFQGVVTDEAGKPIKNATVSIYGNTSDISTNDQGEFLFKNLKDGHYHVHVSAPAYIQQDLEISVSGAQINQKIILETSLIENITVTASALNRSTLESASPISVIANDELRARQSATLGETLNGKPGIHSSYYGPVSASPIIRGFDGPRVKIVQNGLDTGDISRVGGDHAVAAESATATQIEVLRGPASLLFGSGAIGGVVNVVDNRIPKEHQEELTGTVDSRFDTVSDGKTLSGDLNGGIDNFAWHIDAFKRKTNNYHIPGEAENHDDHDDEHEEHGEEEQHGSDRLANSFIDSNGYTLGGSWLLDEGYIGFSYSRLDNKYGIPGHIHGHDEHEDEHHDEHEEHGEEEHEEIVYADMSQDTWQLMGSINTPFANISRIDLKAAYTDYQHLEYEDNIVGTTFNNDSWELRTDFYHHPINEWQGVIGLHASNSDFESFGDEAFTPPTESDVIAAYIVEEKKFNNFTLSLGARVERVDVDPNQVHDDHDHDHDEEHHEDELRSVDYTPFSLSVGIVTPLSSDYSLALSYAYSQRAPSSAELFSNGEHVATQTFEIGGQYEVENEDGHLHIEQSHDDMDEEKSHNVDLTFRKFGGTWGGTFSLFYNQSSDYIYLQDLGITSDYIEDGDHDHDHGGGLPVFHYQQDDVTLYGFESELRIPVATDFRIDLTADYTRGELDDGGDLARMPPLRLGGTFNYDNNDWHADIGVQWYDDQDKTAEFESETEGYTLVNFAINYYWNEWDMFFKGQNIFDEEARVHTSFIKDEAPLPGRNIQLGVRYEF